VSQDPWACTSKSRGKQHRERNQLWEYVSWLANGFGGANLLENTEQDTSGQKITKMSDHTHAGHDDAPSNDKYTEIDRGALELLQQHVAWNFEQDVWHKEDRKYNVPLNVAELQISDHAFDLRILF
jgi:hypothetical protein